MSAFTRLGVQPPDAGLSAASESQAQTREAFGFKWRKRDSYESPAVQQRAREWLLERYCGGDAGRLAAALAGSRKLILDAGCGSGYSALALFGDLLHEHDYLGVDISEAVEVARTRFAERGLPGDFLQHDLMQLPIPDDSVDVVFSEGVLHHTDSTGAAVAALARKLKPGGRFMFYVYARKGPVREYTDDLIRAQIAGMSDEEAWEALKPLTALGIALGKLQATVRIEAAVDSLGIPAGDLDVQRLFYWHVCKAFYREDYSFDEMHHINFDWFRPLNCHRHTREEVERFCDAAGLSIESIDEQLSGITVVAVKRG
jgi:arsenite methyltransferase